MPVRKKDGKWYWGKQGPFDSKQKAEDVAQAAYASGYTKAWLTNPRGSTDDDKHGNADEERKQGFRYKKAIGGWGRGGQQEGTKPTIARSKNRKIDKDLSFGNPQGDSLKRGAYWDEQVEDDDEEESAVQKLMNYQQGRSTNHPSYPPTHGGLLGPKRIDWKKKRNTQPTEFVEKNVQKQVDLFDMPDFWISKFIDIARQRGLEVILKEAEDEEEQPQEPENLDGDEQPIDETTGEGEEDASAGVIQWDTETMGPMPKDKIPIHNPNEAPKGTRLIEGPRGGLYYIGDPEQINNPDYHEAGQKFNDISNQVKTYYEDVLSPIDKELEEMQDAHAAAFKTQADTAGLTFEEMLDALSDENVDNSEADAMEAEMIALEDKRWEAVHKKERLMNEGVDQLLKLFSSNPTVEGVEIKISPTVRFQHGDEELTDGGTRYIPASLYFREAIENEIQMKFKQDSFGKRLIEKSGLTEKSFFREGKFNRLEVPGQKQAQEYYDVFFKGYTKLYLTDAGKQAYYRPDDHELNVNPSVVADLYSDDDTKFFGAMHAITHEMVHSGMHEDENRLRKGMPSELADSMKTIKHVKADGMDNPFSNEHTSNGQMQFNDSHLHDFFEECPTELVSHMILGDRYGQKNKAATREEATKLNYLPDHIGYGDTVPTFARWALAKHNDSPKAARKEVINLLHANDKDSLMNDFIHYMAVGTQANSKEVLETQAKASGDREVKAGLKSNQWTKKHGTLNLDAFEKGELKQFHAGTSKAPTSIDPEDYIKYNKETFKTVPSDTDVKWLLYGERD